MGELFVTWHPRALEGLAWRFLGFTRSSGQEDGDDANIKATWRQLAPGWRDIAMAPRLNSELYLLRLDMNTSLADCLFKKGPQ